MKTFEKLYKEAIAIGQSSYTEDFPPRASFQKGDIVFIGGNTYELQRYTIKKAHSHYGQVGTVVGYKARSMNATLYAVRFADGEVWGYTSHNIIGPFSDVATAAKYAKTPEQAVLPSALTNYKNTGDKINRSIESFISSIATTAPLLFTKLDTPTINRNPKLNEKETTLYTRDIELKGIIQHWAAPEVHANSFRIFRTNKDRTGNLAADPYEISIPDFKPPVDVSEMAKRYGYTSIELYLLYYYNETKKIDFRVSLHNKTLNTYAIKSDYTKKEILNQFNKWNAFVKATKEPSIPNIKELLTLLADLEANKMKSILAASGLYAPGEVKFRDIFAGM